MKSFNRKLLFVLLFILAASYLWAQKPITQGELVALIGEKLDYTTEYAANLKKIGVTPLGEWEPEKALTKDDFDAILVRIARRSPVVELTEPSKILDSLGFPLRDVSREGVEKILESEAFRRIAINPKLFLCQPLLPLPPAYQSVVVGLRDIKQEAMSIAITAPAPAAVLPAPSVVTGETGDPGDADKPPNPPVDPPRCV